MESCIRPDVLNNVVQSLQREETIGQVISEINSPKSDTIEDINYKSKKEILCKRTKQLILIQDILEEKMTEDKTLVQSIDEFKKKLSKNYYLTKSERGEIYRILNKNKHSDINKIMD